MCIFIHHLHHLNFGDLDYFSLIDKEKGEEMFFLDFLPKNGIILIYSLVIESGFEAGFPSLTEEIREIKVSKIREHSINHKGNILRYTSIPRIELRFGEQKWYV